MKNYYFGVDVSKGYSDFVMLDQHKHEVERTFQLDDTFTGHQKMYQFLENFFVEHPDAIVHIGLESTGGYENNWFHTFCTFREKFDLKVARLNPKGVTHHKKAGLKRVITDKVSARSIAEYLITHPEKCVYNDNDPYYAIRKKWKYIKSLSKEKTRYLNKLESEVYVSNPELLSFCKNGFSSWILNVLQLYPSARALAKTSAEKLSQIPYITIERAESLIALARSSVASAGDFLTEDTISGLSEEIQRLEKKIKNQVKILTQHCILPQLDLLLSFPGIGNYSAIGLLIEIGTIERFKSVKHLASYFGLHPIFKESGDGSWGHHMSKQGRAMPRALLYMVTFSAIQINPLIQEIYQKQLSKGKCRMDAMGICMHKILRIIYGILKNNQPFDPDVDRINRIKSVPKYNKEKANKDRKYNDYDEHAPISRRQNKKRKEQEKSQNDEITQNEIIAPAPISLG